MYVLESEKSELVQDLNARLGACVEQLNAFIQKYDLTESVIADHICFKCNCGAAYDRMRQLSEGTPGVYIYQSIVGGRRVSYVRLKQEVSTSAGPIRFLELADRKSEKDSQNTFHHIEIFPSGRPPHSLMAYSAIVQRLKEAGEMIVKNDVPHHVTEDVILEAFIIRISKEPLLQKIITEMQAVVAPA